MNSPLPLIPDFQRPNLILWWLPIISLCGLALILRTANVGLNLPADVGIGTDESYYYLWATALRETGRPDIENGAGYPPGFLTLLAGEQVAIELLKGEVLDPAADYFLIARLVNGVFGTLNVALVAVFAYKITHSVGAGCLAAVLNLFSAQMIQESRRGAANAPWLSFTLIALLLLIQARDSRAPVFLHLALAAGIVSFLFKYQSGVFFILPFIFATLYFRTPGNRAYWWPQLIWAGLLAGLMVWLIYAYGMLEIVNTPSTDADSYISNGQLVGLQSLATNLSILQQAIGSGWLGGAALAALGLCLGIAVLPRLRQDNDQIDLGGVGLLALFSLLFYGLMSLFRPTDPEKWLPLVGLTHILAAAAWPAGFYIVNRLIGPPPLTERAAMRWAPYLLCLLALAVSAPGWVGTYHDSWTRPSSLSVLDHWFKRNYPQGGRVASESGKLLFNYSHPPSPVHNLVVDSIFAETVEQYRERGYDYLIWNDLKSPVPDSLADLSSAAAALPDAREVFRIADGSTTGPSIVVFELSPLAQYPLYAWFTSAISFRGYDLNQEVFQPSAEVRLMLYWESAQIIPTNYIVFIHILNPKTGKLIAGQDGPPDYGNTPTWKWLGDMQFIRDQRIFTIPADAPPGTYTLRIGLYDADTQQRVQVLDLKNQPLGDGLKLQDITIAP